MMTTARPLRARLTVLLIVALAILGASVADASAQTSAGGAFRYWVTSDPTDSTLSRIVLVGAIADFGEVRDIRTAGSGPAPFVRVTLQKGTFRVDLRAVNTAARKAAPSFPINQATCSSAGSVSAPVTTSNGTGLYRGISSKARQTVTFVSIYARSNGACDPTKVVLSTTYVVGTGVVTSP